MSGERYYAKENERKRSRALKERRMYERALRLDLQDAQLADNRPGTGRNIFRRCMCGAHAGSIGVCDDCYRELGGES